MWRGLTNCILFSACAAGDPIAERFAHERAQGTTAAWLVVDAESGEVLSSDGAHMRMLPASVTKLVSSFVALRALGVDYRFITELGFDQPVASKLRANLIIRPSFDPSFASARFRETRDTVAAIADAIAAAGVHVWRGGVRVEGGDAPIYGPGWSQDDLGTEYARPATRFYFAENHTPSVDVPPLRSFEQALASELAARRIDWQPEDIPEAPMAASLVRIDSLPLGDLVRVCNKLSLNLYADAFAFAVNARRGRPHSFEEASATLRSELSEAGLDAKNIELSDGSGLSRYDALTPAFAVALVRAGLMAPFADVWMQSLAVAGIDGTLRRRARSEGPARGYVFAKTGTLRGQRALAGLAYRPGHAARPVVLFAFFVDHHPGGHSGTNALLDELMQLLVK